MAMTETSEHMIWLKHAIEEFKLSYNLILHADSNGAINLAKNQKVSQRSKHIDIRYYFIREHVDTSFQLEYVASENNLADIMTKLLTKTKN